MEQRPESQRQSQCRSTWYPQPPPYYRTLYFRNAQCSWRCNEQYKPYMFIYGSHRRFGCVCVCACGRAICTANVRKHAFVMAGVGIAVGGLLPNIWRALPNAAACDFVCQGTRHHVCDWCRTFVGLLPVSVLCSCACVCEYVGLALLLLSDKRNVSSVHSSHHRDAGCCAIKCICY